MFSDKVKSIIKFHSNMPFEALPGDVKVLTFLWYNGVFFRNSYVSKMCDVSRSYACQIRIRHGLNMDMDRELHKITDFHKAVQYCFRVDKFNRSAMMDIIINMYMLGFGARSKDLLGKHVEAKASLSILRKRFS